MRGFKPFILGLFAVLLGPTGGAQARPAPAPVVTADAADEEAARNAILRQVEAAISAKDYDALSAMEEDFQSSRARTPSGTWKLATFHAGLQYYLAEGRTRENGCRPRRPRFVDDWAAAQPHSPAPVITRAALLLAQGWCHRGSGYAASVAEEAWPRFHEAAAAAYEALDRHSAMASADPEFYAVKLDVLRALAADRNLFRAVLDEAASREPDYHRTYFNAVWYSLPQWGGSFAEVEELARYAADRTRESEGTGLYARMFWYLEECDCRIAARAADWRLLKQSMRDVYDRYPVAWNATFFADLSCQLRQLEEAQYYIRASHPDAGDDTLSALFAACDRKARSGA